MDEPAVQQNWYELKPKATFEGGVQSKTHSENTVSRVKDTKVMWWDMRKCCWVYFKTFFRHLPPLLRLSTCWWASCWLWLWPTQRTSPLLTCSMRSSTITLPQTGCLVSGQICIRTAVRANKVIMKTSVYTSSTFCYGGPFGSPVKHHWIFTTSDLV